MKMLEDLEEVVRLRLRANQEHAALDFIRTHHATIRDMAARLEAAEGDAARYRVTQKITPYRFKKIQDVSISDAGDVLYFHKDRFDSEIDAMQEAGR
jgi:nucleoside-diphosphate-sugar epimerase